MDSRTDTETGLTILELLIAIAVVAVLIILAIPATGVIQERFKSIGCINNLRQFGVTFASYAADHSRRLPRSEYNSNGVVVNWQNALDNYITPAFSNLGKSKVTRSIFICPSEPPPLATCYALNQEFRIDAQGDKSLIRQAEIVSPSKYVLIADAHGSSWITSGRKTKMVEVNKLTRRHSGFPNFLYADGHAASFTQDLLGYSDTTDPFYQALWLARYRPN